ILAGQVCMQGLQTQLENRRQSYLNQKENNAGPCSGTSSKEMSTFCNTSVPDFIGSVNTVSVQGANPTAGNFSVHMPNFDSNSPYSFLNGYCGTITWNNIKSLSKTVSRRTVHDDGQV